MKTTFSFVSCHSLKYKTILNCAKNIIMPSLSNIFEIPIFILLALWFPLVLIIFWIMPDRKRKIIVNDLSKLLKIIFSNKPPNPK